MNIGDRVRINFPDLEEWHGREGVLCEKPQDASGFDSRGDYHWINVPNTRITTWPEKYLILLTPFPDWTGYRVLT